MHIIGSEFIVDIIGETQMIGEILIILGSTLLFLLPLIFVLIYCLIMALHKLVYGNKTQILKLLWFVVVIYIALLIGQIIINTIGSYLFPEVFYKVSLALPVVGMFIVLYGLFYRWKRQRNNTE